MRKLIIALALTTALATPAAARDGSPYVGIEGGFLALDTFDFDYTDATRNIENAYSIRHKKGFDVDAIAGYDFGSFRLEGEIAYKRATAKNALISNSIALPSIPNSLGYDVDGRSTALSVMLNGLLDFGDGPFSGYLGGGIGAARVEQRLEFAGINRSFRGRDSGMAYQLIGGVRYAVTPNVDVGLKYRMFTVNTLKYDVDGPPAFEINANDWRSNSLLASIVYNFAAPAVVVAPPVIVEQAPPPVEAPATQTCPDGSVILATDVCPAPPPPPPGERG